MVVGLAGISACVTFGERWQSPSVNTLTGILLKVFFDSDIDLQDDWVHINILGLPGVNSSELSARSETDKCFTPEQHVGDSLFNSKTQGFRVHPNIKLPVSRFPTGAATLALSDTEGAKVS